MDHATRSQRDRALSTRSRDRRSPYNHILDPSRNGACGHDGPCWGSAHATPLRGPFGIGNYSSASIAAGVRCRDLTMAFHRSWCSVRRSRHRPPPRARPTLGGRPRHRPLLSPTIRFKTCASATPPAPTLDPGGNGAHAPPPRRHAPGQRGDLVTDHGNEHASASRPSRSAASARIQCWTQASEGN